jgi:hypothetical protein
LKYFVYWEIIIEAMLKWLTIFVFTLSAFPFNSEAQSFYSARRNRNLMIGGGSGIAYYSGEMVNPGSVGIIKPNIAFQVEYFFFSRISARAAVTWFQISGNDANANDSRKQRNLSFRSNNFEANATVAISLIPQGSRFYQRSRINLHAFTGIGILQFNPSTKYQGDWISLPALETEGVNYSTVQPVIPFGLGMRLKVDPFFSILIEGAYRKTFTDYLDDVSARKYPDPKLLKSDLARSLADRRPEIGTQPADPTKGVRGNPETDDGYFLLNVLIQYYIPTEIFKSQKKLYTTKRKIGMKRRR